MAMNWKTKGSCTILPYPDIPQFISFLMTLALQKFNFTGQRPAQPDHEWLHSKILKLTVAVGSPPWCSVAVHFPESTYPFPFFAEVNCSRFIHCSAPKVDWITPSKARNRHNPSIACKACEQQKEGDYHVVGFVYKVFG